MIEVSLTEARARLPELLTRAAEGEEVRILRHGNPAGVLVGHAQWVKTKQHDVLIQARELRRQREAARGRPWPPPGWEPTMDPKLAQEILDYIREGRERDPWDVVDG